MRVRLKSVRLPIAMGLLVLVGGSCGRRDLARENREVDAVQWLASLPHHALEGQGAPEVETRASARIARKSATEATGRRKVLSANRGRIVVLNFWGTGCGPCVAEQPDLSAVAERFRSRGVRVIGIALGDTGDRVRAYARQHGVGYPLIADVEQLTAKAYSVMQVPQTFVIDREGTVRIWCPASVTEERLAAAVEALL